MDGIAKLEVLLKDAVDQSGKDQTVLAGNDGLV